MNVSDEMIYQQYPRHVGRIAAPRRRKGAGKPFDEFAVIDAEDIEKVGRWCWTCRINRDGSKYALAFVRRKSTYLHRFVYSSDSSLDHKNRNGLHCFKGNLRPATHMQNMWNKAVQKNNKSGFKGVRKRPNHAGWTATIKINRKSIHIGTYDTPEQASRAYFGIAKRYAGEFARRA